MRAAELYGARIPPVEEPGSCEFEKMMSKLIEVDSSTATFYYSHLLRSSSFLHLLPLPPLLAVRLILLLLGPLLPPFPEHLPEPVLLLVVCQHRARPHSSPEAGGVAAGAAEAPRVHGDGAAAAALARRRAAAVRRRPLRAPEEGAAAEAGHRAVVHGLRIKMSFMAFAFFPVFPGGNIKEWERTDIPSNVNTY